jgi:alanine racemase
VRIDLDALRHNYRLARRLHGGRALAVLKANAYGHGAVQCALALGRVADGFAVAFLDEAVALRMAGIRSPILLLEGLFDTQEFAKARDLDLWFVVHHDAQLCMIELDSSTSQFPVWLKADSGMGRVGFSLPDMRSAYARLLASKKVSEIVLMTHFARANETGSDATMAQLIAFDTATAGLPGDRSLCNSAGILAWPGARRDWARPGILLYGADPLSREDSLAEAALQPVMNFESAIVAVRTLQAGQALGYGGDFIADSPTRVGLVPVGYADGYPRRAPTGTPVAVDGQFTHLIGCVSMDMLTVDLTSLPTSGIGSRVELWGRKVSVNEIARRAGTISYEVLCNVKRVPITYTGQQSMHASSEEDRRGAHPSPSWSG